ASRSAHLARLAQRAPAASLAGQKQVLPTRTSPAGTLGWTGSAFTSCCARFCSRRDRAVGAWRRTRRASLAARSKKALCSSNSPTTLTLPTIFQTTEIPAGNNGIFAAEQIFVCPLGGLFCDKFLTGGGTLLGETTIFDQQVTTFP